ncbi:M35 family metallo-endopeptidase [Roseateles sp. BYS180W]|uniref:M35 family metallo-endopeptidase n=1 Tax=Roseateles rivi TaxID=3299028 RepID=A0ABW7FY86_9BURK
MQFSNKVLVLSVLAVASHGVWAQSSALEVDVSVPTTASASKAVLARVTLRNTSAQPVKVLKSLLPVAGQSSMLFDISRDGQPLPYVGAVRLRRAPVASDYLTLAAGKSVSYSVDLREHVDFSASGHYTVRYRVESPDGDMSVLTSLPRTVWISAAPTVRSIEAASAVSQMTRSFGGNVTFDGCSAQQREDINAAFAQARSYIRNAVAHLENNNWGTVRYTTWFGTYDQARHDELLGKMRNIRDTFENETITADCGCNTSDYAWVKPGIKYRVHLCKSFWPAPVAGTDSKAGTLIHETSHFHGVGNTSDIRYRQDRAQLLAQRFPERAIHNADSYEYFSENNPKLD